ncbi:MAG TPA: hypothetical protein VF796_26785 [Humisphaera sp.]
MLKGRRHFGFKRPDAGEPRARPYQPPPRPEFEVGSRVSIDPAAVDEAAAAKLAGRDLAGAMVIGATTGGARLLVKLSDQYTLMLPRAALAAAGTSAETQ